MVASFGYQVGTTRWSMCSRPKLGEWFIEFGSAPGRTGCWSGPSQAISHSGTPATCGKPVQPPGVIFDPSPASCPELPEGGPGDL